MLVTDWSGQSSSGLSAALMAYCGTSPTAIGTLVVPTWNRARKPSTSGTAQPIPTPTA